VKRDLKILSEFDHVLVTPMTASVKMLTVSKAKANFSGIARNIARFMKPVIVRVSNGFIQIAPFALPAEVPPFQPGSLKLLPREVDLHNTFGKSL
jgi:hypothetical protein